MAPSVAGVVFGLCLPTVRRPGLRRGAPPEVRAAGEWEARLEPAVTLVVLPLFALANAGLRFVGSGLATAAALGVLVAIVVGRVVGKLIAVPAATWCVGRIGGAEFHAHPVGRNEIGVGALASVGYTVPLLMIHQALPDGPLAAGATAGLLVATVLGALLGTIVFRTGR